MSPLPRDLPSKLAINCFSHLELVTGLASFFYGVSSIIETPLGLANVSAPAGGLLIYESYRHYRNQNKRFDKIVRLIEEHGFDRRVAAPFMGHLCGRIAVRAALKHTNQLNKYYELKASLDAERRARRSRPAES